MQNMTGDRFPFLSPRKPRGTERELRNAGGILAREKLFWIDGSEAFYGGEKVGEVSEGKKRLLSMGARVLIFPDKKYYNTADGEFGNLENKFVSAGTVRYSQSWLTETELSARGQTYVKLQATGIEAGFRKGDGVEISGFTPEELNKTTVIKDIGEGYITIVAAIEKDGSQTGAVTIWRKLPDMDFLTVAENRLWGCSSKNHEIYASKLGSPFNFYCFEGLASDSYAATVANDGDFTGAITYLGYVLFFKENSVQKIYGSKPANFQMIEGQLRGVEAGSADSLQIVNEVLYYKSADGIMSYQGSMPYAVGAVIEKGYKNAVAGSSGSKYYVSMEKEGKHSLFVYDAGKGLWHREDDTNAAAFTRMGDKLYYLEGNTLRTTEGGDEEVIEWEAVTGDLPYRTAESKFISRLSLRCSVALGALEVWIDYDSRGAWQRLRSMGGKGLGLRSVPLIPQRCDHFRLKLRGYGECLLQDLTVFISYGSNERRR